MNCIFRGLSIPDNTGRYECHYDNTSVDLEGDCRYCSNYKTQADKYGEAVCCMCKHFRMWKPQKMYCTVKKEVVDPESICKEYSLRKGLPMTDGSRT